MEQQPESDILDAVQSGDIATVKKFLDEGVPVDLTDEEGWSLLHHAAALGQVKVINLLREKGCHVDLIDNEGRTPLHYAATNGDIETIRLLIEMGSNVNSVDNEGNTPLKWSVMCEQNAVIEELTKQGGTVDVEEMEPLLLPFQDPGHILGDGNNEVCQSNQTELTTDIQHVSTAATSNDSYKHSDHNSHQTDLVTTKQCMDTNADTTQLEGDIFEAAQCGDTATVKGYLDLGVPVDVTDEDGWSPVHHAIAHHQVEVIRLLMDRGCLMNPVKNRKQATKGNEQKSSNLHVTTEGGSTYSTYNTKQLYEDVFEAARCGDTATFQSYLNSGGSVDLTDEDGRTLLHCAAGEGQMKVVELLIKRGCRTDPVDKNECTPLDYATVCGHVQTVQLLKQQSKEHLEEQYFIDSVDSQGRSVLHFAAASGDIHLIEMLAEQRLYVNIGRTPLHYAAACGKLESVRTLLRLGGRESMTKIAGTRGTPLHQAVGRGHKDIVSWLLNEGCPINVVDNRGRSVFHYAAQYGQIHMIEMLAEQGLDINIGDDEAWTPLHKAAACGQLKSVRTLLRLGGRESMTKVAGAGGTPLHQAVAGGHKDIVSLLLNEGCPINVVDREGGSFLIIAARYGQIHMIEMLAEQGLDVNMGDNEGLTSLHHAAGFGQVTTFKEIVRIGGTIHLVDKFGMKFSDWILISQSSATVKQFCVACGLECDDEGLLGVISVLIANNLLDTNRILCLAAVCGDISIFDAMVTSPYPLNQQKMPKIAICLFSASGGKNLQDHFHVSEEPLNPLHISILSKFLLNIYSRNTKKFIEKLISHPLTQYMVNELFPNGLSPLDVARRFELHDIAVIMERAGGGPGVWGNLPKEVEDKAIDLFTSLKELRGREFGEKATSNILSMLGYQVVEDAKKFLEESPVLHLLEQFLLYIKSKGKWKHVGRLLKVDEDTLKRLSEEATDEDDAYYSMLEYWLEHGCNVSWKNLLDVVGHFETKKTVDHITDKIVEELTPSQVSIQTGSFHFKLQTFVVLHIYTTTLASSLYQPTVSIHWQCL